MVTVTELIQSSKRVSSGDFKETLTTARQIIREERRSGSFGSAHVTGGLVTFPASGSLMIIGDLHGDLDGLSEILEESKALDALQGREDFTLLFLGDYGDRGAYSTEVYHVVLTLKTRFPDNVLLMRGNHEGPLDVEFYPYDLPDQLLDRFGRSGEEIHQMIRELWQDFYHGARVEESYLILHGGVPTEAKKLEDITKAGELHPQDPHLMEILWNDPRDGLRGTLPSSRGIGKLFGADVTSRILELTETKTLIRGHEVCQGVRVNHGGKVLTIFSSKGPYGLPEAAFLKIDLRHERMSAYDLAKNATKF